jgi:mannan endo-1,4-beta-mannosidase
MITFCDNIPNAEKQKNHQNQTISPISPVSGAVLTDLEIQFEWDSGNNATKYRHQVSKNAVFSEIVSDTVINSSTLQLNGFQYGEEYAWRVSPIMGTDNENWSNISHFSVKQSPDRTGSITKNFVQARNADFYLDGEKFHFSGTNAYYLPNYQKINPKVVDRAFRVFKNTDINVVRMWGFYDGYDCGYSSTDPNENVIQTEPGVYSEEALKDLDEVIARGKEQGIYFIIPFINYWDQLGGICQYNTWAGASNPSTNMEFFLSNEKTQKWYKDYISMLLNRVNTVTGVKYKNEPAIFAWQIMNEGRNSGKDPEIMRDWYQEIAQYIKSIDSNHMVSTGEEGFDAGTPSNYSVDQYDNTYALRANEGTSYLLNINIPEIDFGNAHWYPTEYGFGTEVDDGMLAAQRAWLSDHQAIAENIGKPAIIGEYGYPGWGDERVDSIYSRFYDHAESIELDGDLLWEVTAGSAKCWEFGGNICYPGGRGDTVLYEKYKEHVEVMKTEMTSTPTYIR